MAYQQQNWQWIIAKLSEGQEGLKSVMHYLAPNAGTLLSRSTQVASSFMMFVMVRVVSGVFSAEAVKTENRDLAGAVNPINAPNFWIIMLSMLAVLVHGGFQWFYLLSKETHKTIAALTQSLSTIGISEFFRQDKKVYDGPAYIFMLLALPGVIQLLFFALGKLPTRDNVKQYLDIAHKFCRDNQFFTFVRVGASTGATMTAFVATFIENYYNATHEDNLVDSRKYLLISAIVGFLIGTGANNAAEWREDKTAGYIKNELPGFLVRMFFFYNFYQTFNIMANPALVGPNSVEKFKEQEVQNNIVFLILLFADCLKTMQNIMAPELSALCHPYKALPPSGYQAKLKVMVENFALFLKNAVGWQGHGQAVTPRIEELPD